MRKLLEKNRKWTALSYFVTGYFFFAAAIILFIQAWGFLDYTQSPYVIRKVFGSDLYNYQVGGLEAIANAVVYSGGAVMSAVLSHMFLFMSFSKKTVLNVLPSEKGSSD